MQECISMCIDEDLVDKIKLAPSYNLMTDESTDISLEKHSIIYASFFGSEGRSETHFLAHVILNDGCSAIGITKCLEECLDQKGLNCLCLATDGAKVMTGEVGHLAGILKRKNPYLVFVHCTAHRLSLATSQAADTVPYLKRYTKCIGVIYSYFSRFLSRLTCL